MSAKQAGVLIILGILYSSSSIFLFEPITAILVGTLVFGEALTTNIVVGIAIAVVAVTFMIAVTKR